MTEEAVHPTENLAGYVLGALEDSEGIRVETHVATCVVCAGVLAQYRAVVSALPMGLDPVTPPPEAWAAIRAEARRRRLPVREGTGTGVRPKWRRAMWPILTTLVASLLVWTSYCSANLRGAPPGRRPARKWKRCRAAQAGSSSWRGQASRGRARASSSRWMEEDISQSVV